MICLRTRWSLFLLPLVMMSTCKKLTINEILRAIREAYQEDDVIESIRKSPEKMVAFVDDDPLGGKSLLMYAAAYNRLSIAQFLLSCGADVNQRSIFYGRPMNTPLIYAASWGHQEMVKLLLSSGAQVDVQGSMASSALMFAAVNGHREVVKLLLDAGAKVDLQDTKGQTALALASWYGHADVVKLLVEAGADVNLQRHMRYSGSTPLIKAQGMNDLEIVSTLTKAGANLNIQDAYGYTVTHYMAKGKDEAGLGIILPYCPNLTIREHETNATAADLALANGYISTAQLLLGHRNKSCLSQLGQNDLSGLANVVETFEAYTGRADVATESGERVSIDGRKFTPDEGNFEVTTSHVNFFRDGLESIETNEIKDVRYGAARLRTYESEFLENVTEELLTKRILTDSNPESYYNEHETGETISLQQKKVRDYSINNWKEIDLNTNSSDNVVSSSIDHYNSSQVMMESDSSRSHQFTLESKEGSLTTSGTIGEDTIKEQVVSKALIESDQSNRDHHGSNTENIPSFIVESDIKDETSAKSHAEVSISTSQLSEKDLQMMNSDTEAAYQGLSLDQKLLTSYSSEVRSPELKLVGLKEFSEKRYQLEKEPNEKDSFVTKSIKIELLESNDFSVIKSSDQDVLEMEHKDFGCSEIKGGEEIDNVESANDAISKDASGKQYTENAEMWNLEVLEQGADISSFSSSALGELTSHEIMASNTESMYKQRSIDSIALNDKEFEKPESNDILDLAFNDETMLTSNADDMHPFGESSNDQHKEYTRSSTAVHSPHLQDSGQTQLEVNSGNFVSFEEKDERELKMSDSLIKPLFQIEQSDKQSAPESVIIESRVSKDEMLESKELTFPKPTDPGKNEVMAANAEGYLENKISSMEDALELNISPEKTVLELGHNLESYEKESSEFQPIQKKELIQELSAEEDKSSYLQSSDGSQSESESGGFGSFEEKLMDKRIEDNTLESNVLDTSGTFFPNNRTLLHSGTNHIGWLEEKTSGNKIVQESEEDSSKLPDSFDKTQPEKSVQESEKDSSKLPDSLDETQPDKRVQKSEGESSKLPDSLDETQPEKSVLESEKYSSELPHSLDETQPENSAQEPEEDSSELPEFLDETQPKKSVQESEENSSKLPDSLDETQPDKRVQESEEDSSEPPDFLDETQPDKSAQESEKDSSKLPHSLDKTQPEKSLLESKQDSSELPEFLDETQPDKSVQNYEEDSSKLPYSSDETQLEKSVQESEENSSELSDSLDETQPEKSAQESEENSSELSDSLDETQPQKSAQEAEENSSELSDYLNETQSEKSAQESEENSSELSDSLDETQPEKSAQEAEENSSELSDYLNETQSEKSSQESEENSSELSNSLDVTQSQKSAQESEENSSELSDSLDDTQPEKSAQESEEDSSELSDSLDKTQPEKIAQESEDGSSKLPEFLDETQPEKSAQESEEDSSKLPASLNETQTEKSAQVSKEGSSKLPHALDKTQPETSAQESEEDSSELPDSLNETQPEKSAKKSEENSSELPEFLDETQPEKSAQESEEDSSELPEFLDETQPEKISQESEEDSFKLLDSLNETQPEKSAQESEEDSSELPEFLDETQPEKISQESEEDSFKLPDSLNETQPEKSAKESEENSSELPDSLDETQPKKSVQDSKEHSFKLLDYFDETQPEMQVEGEGTKTESDIALTSNEVLSTNQSKGESQFSDTEFIKQENSDDQDVSESLKSTSAEVIASINSLSKLVSPDPKVLHENNLVVSELNDVSALYKTSSDEEPTLELNIPEEDFIKNSGSQMKVSELDISESKLFLSQGSSGQDQPELESSHTKSCREKAVGEIEYEKSIPNITSELAYTEESKYNNLNFSKQAPDYQDLPNAMRKEKSSHKMVNAHSEDLQGNPLALNTLHEKELEKPQLELPMAKTLSYSESDRFGPDKEEPNSVQQVSVSEIESENSDPLSFGISFKEESGEGAGGKVSILSVEDELDQQYKEETKSKELHVSNQQISEVKFSAIKGKPETNSLESELGNQNSSKIDSLELESPSYQTILESNNGKPCFHERETSAEQYVKENKSVQQLSNSDEKPDVSHLQNTFDQSHPVELESFKAKSIEDREAVVLDSDSKSQYGEVSGEYPNNSEISEDQDLPLLTPIELSPYALEIELLESTALDDEKLQLQKVEIPGDLILPQSDIDEIIQSDIRASGNSYINNLHSLVDEIAEGRSDDSRKFKKHAVGTQESSDSEMILDQDLTNVSNLDKMHNLDPLLTAETILSEIDMPTVACKNCDMIYSEVEALEGQDLIESEHQEYQLRFKEKEEYSSNSAILKPKYENTQIPEPIVNDTTTFDNASDKLLFTETPKTKVFETYEFDREGVVEKESKGLYHIPEPLENTDVAKVALELDIFTKEESRQRPQATDSEDQKNNGKSKSILSVEFNEEKGQGLQEEVSTEKVDLLSVKGVGLKSEQSEVEIAINSELLLSQSSELDTSIETSVQMKLDEDKDFMMKDLNNKSISNKKQTSDSQDVQTSSSTPKLFDQKLSDEQDFLERKSNNTNTSRFIFSDERNEQHSDTGEHYQSVSNELLASHSEALSPEFEWSGNKNINGIELQESDPALFNSFSNQVSADLETDAKEPLKSKLHDEDYSKLNLEELCNTVGLVTIDHISEELNMSNDDKALLESTEREILHSKIMFDQSLLKTVDNNVHFLESGVTGQLKSDVIYSELDISRDHKMSQLETEIKPTTETETNDSNTQDLQEVQEDSFVTGSLVTDLTMQKSSLGNASEITELVESRLQNLEYTGISVSELEVQNHSNDQKPQSREESSEIYSNLGLTVESSSELKDSNNELSPTNHDQTKVEANPIDENRQNFNVNHTNSQDTKVFSEEKWPQESDDRKGQDDQDMLKSDLTDTIFPLFKTTNTRSQDSWVTAPSEMKMSDDQALTEGMPVGESARINALDGNHFDGLEAIKEPSKLKAYDEGMEVVESEENNINDKYFQESVDRNYKDIHVLMSKSINEISTQGKILAKRALEKHEKEEYNEKDEFDSSFSTLKASDNQTSPDHGLVDLDILDIEYVNENSGFVDIAGENQQVQNLSKSKQDHDEKNALISESLVEVMPDSKISDLTNSDFEVTQSSEMKTKDGLQHNLYSLNVKTPIYLENSSPQPSEMYDIDLEEVSLTLEDPKIASSTNLPSESYENVKAIIKKSFTKEDKALVKFKDKNPDSQSHAVVKSSSVSESHSEGIGYVRRIASSFTRLVRELNKEKVKEDNPVRSVSERLESDTQEITNLGDQELGMEKSQFVKRNISASNREVDTNISTANETKGLMKSSNVSREDETLTQTYKKNIKILKDVDNQSVKDDHNTEPAILEVSSISSNLDGETTPTIDSPHSLLSAVDVQGSVVYEQSNELFSERDHFDLGEDKIISEANEMNESPDIPFETSLQMNSEMKITQILETNTSVPAELDSNLMYSTEVCGPGQEPTECLEDILQLQGNGGNNHPERGLPNEQYSSKIDYFDSIFHKPRLTEDQDKTLIKSNYNEKKPQNFTPTTKEFVGAESQNRGFVKRIAAGFSLRMTEPNKENVNDLKHVKLVPEVLEFEALGLKQSNDHRNYEQKLESTVQNAAKRNEVNSKEKSMENGSNPDVRKRIVEIPDTSKSKEIQPPNPNENSIIMKNVQSNCERKETMLESREVLPSTSATFEKTNELQSELPSIQSLDSSKPGNMNLMADTGNVLGSILFSSQGSIENLNETPKSDIRKPILTELENRNLEEVQSFNLLDDAVSQTNLYVDRIVNLSATEVTEGTNLLENEFAMEISSDNFDNLVISGNEGFYLREPCANYIEETFVNQVIDDALTQSEAIALNMVTPDPLALRTVNSNVDIVSLPVIVEQSEDFYQETSHRTEHDLRNSKEKSGNKENEVRTSYSDKEMDFELDGTKDKLSIPEIHINAFERDSHDTFQEILLNDGDSLSETDNGFGRDLTTQKNSKESEIQYSNQSVGISNNPNDAIRDELDADEIHGIDIANVQYIDEDEIKDNSDVIELYVPVADMNLMDLEETGMAHIDASDISDIGISKAQTDVVDALFIPAEMINDFSDDNISIEKHLTNVDNLSTGKIAKSDSTGAGIHDDPVEIGTDIYDAANTPMYRIDANNANIDDEGAAEADLLDLEDIEVATVFANALDLDIIEGDRIGVMSVEVPEGVGNEETIDVSAMFADVVEVENITSGTPDIDVLGPRTPDLGRIESRFIDRVAYQRYAAKSLRSDGYFTPTDTLDAESIDDLEIIFANEVDAVSNLEESIGIDAANEERVGLESPNTYHRNLLDSSRKYSVASIASEFFPSLTEVDLSKIDDHDMSSTEEAVLHTKSDITNSVEIAGENILTSSEFPNDGHSSYLDDDSVANPSVWERRDSVSSTCSSVGKDIEDLIIAISKTAYINVASVAPSDQLEPVTEALEINEMLPSDDLQRKLSDASTSSSTELSETHQRKKIFSSIEMIGSTDDDDDDDFTLTDTSYAGTEISITSTEDEFERSNTLREYIQRRRSSHTDDINYVVEMGHPLDRDDSTETGIPDVVIKNAEIVHEIVNEVAEISDDARSIKKVDLAGCDTADRTTTLETSGSRSLSSTDLKNESTSANNGFSDLDSLDTDVSNIINLRHGSESEDKKDSLYIPSEDFSKTDEGKEVPKSSPNFSVINITEAVIITNSEDNSETLIGTMKYSLLNDDQKSSSSRLDVTELTASSQGYNVTPDEATKKITSGKSGTIGNHSKDISKESRPSTPSRIKKYLGAITEESRTPTPTGIMRYFDAITKGSRTPTPTGFRKYFSSFKRESRTPTPTRNTPVIDTEVEQVSGDANRDSKPGTDVADIFEVEISSEITEAFDAEVIGGVSEPGQADTNVVYDADAAVDIAESIISDQESDGTETQLENSPNAAVPVNHDVEIKSTGKTSKPFSSVSQIINAELLDAAHQVEKADSLLSLATSQLTEVLTTVSQSEGKQAFATDD